MPVPYVLLVRHASRDRKWDQPESKHPMKAWREDLCAPKVSQSVFSAFWCKAPAADSDKQGLPITCSLAGQLCDQLAIDNIVVEEILSSEHEVARQTAEVFAHVLKKRGPIKNRGLTNKCEKALTPAKNSSEAKANNNRVVEEIERWAKNLREAKATSNAATEMSEGAGESYLVIGHQPQLTHIARSLLDESLRYENWLWFLVKLKNLGLFKHPLPGNVLPLGSSEIACIELGKNPRLLWLMTEKSPELLTELKTKIASKFEVAKFFLGALVVGTGLTLSDAVWNLSNRNAKLVAGIGAFAALLSLGLTAATLFSYDRLLMPQDFWLGTDKEDDKPGRQWWRRMRGAGSPWSVSRPPSQAHVILFYEMVHIWTRLFTPAMLSAFVAVGLVVAARAHNSLTVPAFYWTPVFMQAHPLLTFLLLALFAFVLGFLAFRRFKPSLGFDD